MLANISNYFGSWSTPLTIMGFTIGGIALIVILLWSIYWKGLALWKAAHNNSKPWFVALLLINTIGILEILYIYIFSKKKTQQQL